MNQNTALKSVCRLVVLMVILHLGAAAMMAEDIRQLSPDLQSYIQSNPSTTRFLGNENVTRL